MSIPKYNEFYRDVLNVLQDGAIHSIADVRKQIAARRGFTAEELSERIQSGKQTLFAGRVGWATTYLKAAGLVSKPVRAKLCITEEGRRVQQDKSIVLNNEYLMRYPAFAEFVRPSHPVNQPQDTLSPMESDRSDPMESIDTAYRQINSALADQLLLEIMGRDSVFFERLVVMLLRNMGYGGPFDDAFQVTQRSNDGGIDGIIKEDPLGFSKIFIQAKRWDPEKSVNRPDIQMFSGALQDAGAYKGLFITTAKFSAGAKESAEKQHIVLVDGKMLTRLMIEYNLGVSVSQTYTIKEVDHDFFDEEKD